MACKLLVSKPRYSAAKVNHGILSPARNIPLATKLHTNFRAVTNSLIQPKLEIRAPNNKYEREADLLADQVINMPDPGTEQTGNLSSPYRPLAEHATSLIQRQEESEEEEEEEEEPVQAKAFGHASEATLNFTNGIRSLRGRGQPLSPSERHFFEPRIGYDFSRVHIHTGDHASRLAAEINARAFTLGSDIVFGAGQYQPYSERGRRLLAHELTHVVQQADARVGNLSLVQREVPASPAAAADGGLNHDMLRQIARRLREAMAGWGTDEEAIYSAFSGRTQEQVDAISRVYQEMFQRSLIADLRDELTDSEMRHLAIFSPTAAIREGEEPARNLADMIAHQLNRAMDRIGTDEEAVYAALTGRTVAERQTIKAAYRRLTGRELEADIRSEFSGSELTEALRLLNQGMLAPEDELYLAMEGAGTDEATIFRVLEQLGGSGNEIRSMESAYRAKYGDLLNDLRGDLNAEEYTRAIRLLRFLSGYIPDVRYSSRRVYGFSRRDATQLYGAHNATNLVPASAFSQLNTIYTDYTKRWENQIAYNQLQNLGGDCGRYAEHLIGLSGRTPPPRPGTQINRPGIGLAPASDLQPGEAYFILPRAQRSQEELLRRALNPEMVTPPWGNREPSVEKRPTNFHVATVVARDNTTAITSEVNAAFAGRVRPWFAMYSGSSGFYRTYRTEYRVNRRDPALFRL
jgi:hypothetical protein